MRIQSCGRLLLCALFTVIFCLPQTTAYAQLTGNGVTGQDSTGVCVNTVFTSIPFLRINPDGRTGGMGEVGLATQADAASIYHNASKLAFAEKDLGVTLTYTPWLRNLVDDIYIAYLAGYKKIDDNQAIGLSLRYFSLGQITFTDAGGNKLQDYNPNEMAVDLAYARKLSQNLSTSITLKYARSDLARGQEVGASGNLTRAAQAVAADIGVYYENPNLTWFGQGNKLTVGGAMTNIGNKVAYSDGGTRDFIPINLGLGAGLDTDLDEHNSLFFGFEINKLMTPTPDGTEDPRNRSLLNGMFGSFGDAPGGFSEEMTELMYSVGVEYWYNDQFALRAGHFNEHQCKGNRKYITLGLGLRYSVFGLNFSYIVPTSNQRNPLDNTLRFSLTFDFDGNNEAN